VSTEFLVCLPGVLVLLALVLWAVAKACKAYPVLMAATLTCIAIFAPYSLLQG
jgi:hypothetical protein